VDWPWGRGGFIGKQAGEKAVRMGFINREEF